MPVVPWQPYSVLALSWKLVRVYGAFLIINVWEVNQSLFHRLARVAPPHFPLGLPLGLPPPCPRANMPEFQLSPNTQRPLLFTVSICGAICCCYPPLLALPLLLVLPFHRRMMLNLDPKLPRSTMHISAPNGHMGLVRCAEPAESLACLLFFFFFFLLATSLYEIMELC